VSLNPENQNTANEAVGLVIAKLHGSLQKLIGYHRQLLEAVRAEKDALVQAEMKAIRETTCSKQVLVESIRLEEAARVRIVGELAILWKRDPATLSLNEIIIQTQGESQSASYGLGPKVSDQLRSSFNAIQLLVKRVIEQNRENAGCVERSLEHISNMKKNVLGEAAPASQTYTQQGTRSQPGSGARLLSREA
jgi:hypothetical protein